MAFVFIDKSVDSVVREYQYAIKVLEDSSNRDRLDSYREKLRVIRSYQQRLKQSSAFKKIKRLRSKDKAEYISQCREICKPIAGVSFDTRSLLFVVRCTFDGKRSYVGAVESFDDAVDILEMYLKHKSQS